MSLRGHSGSLAVHALGPPMGDILPMETLPDPLEAVATTVATPETDNLCPKITPPSMPVPMLPLLWGRITSKPVRAGALSILCRTS